MEYDEAMKWQRKFADKAGRLAGNVTFLLTMTKLPGGLESETAKLALEHLEISLREFNRVLSE